MDSKRLNKTDKERGYYHLEARIHKGGVCILKVWERRVFVVRQSSTCEPAVWIESRMVAKQKKKEEKRKKTASTFAATQPRVHVLPAAQAPAGVVTVVVWLKSEISLRKLKHLEG